MKETKDEWIISHQEELMEKYEFDVRELLRDFNIEQFIEIKSFGEYCDARYVSEIEDELEDLNIRYLSDLKD